MTNPANDASTKRKVIFYRDSQYRVELIQHEPEAWFDMWAPAGEWKKVRQCTEFFVYEQDEGRIAYGAVHEGGFEAAIERAVAAISDHA